MIEVSSIKNIASQRFLIKFGQDFCIPCEVTENNLKELECYFNFPFYSTKNVDEAVERGYKSLPVVAIFDGGNCITLDDSSVLMNKDELKKWIENHQELKDAVELKEGE